MKRKLFVPAAVIILCLLACSCPISAIPVRISTATPKNSSGNSTTASPTIASPAPPISGSETPFQFDWNDRKPFEKNLSAGTQSILSGLQGASVYHIAFSLADPPTQINGVEEVLYTNTESVPLNEVDFAVFSEILGGSITISKLEADGQALPAGHQNGIMRVMLKSALDVGESIKFHIEFQVTAPTQGGGYYYGIFGYNDSILSMAHAYPTILVYNEDGWNNQPPDLDGDPLFSDTSFYIVSVDAPKSLVLAATGVEVQRSENNDRQQVLYADGPARDFYLAASAGFHKKSATSNGVTINSYTLSQEEQYSQSALTVAKAAIEDFSKRYAPYPYTEFDIVPIVTEAGGVEFPGMTAVSEGVYGAGTFLEVVVTHEIGHQWFYNLVGNETQQQPWLDESAAEFVTWQYYLDVHGDAAAQSYSDEMKGSWDSVGDKKMPIGEPVSAYTSDEYVGIVYGRGPFFYLALRQQIGTASFDNFMKDYVEQYSWKIATTQDFKALAEKHCNCNLTSLFNDWVNP